MLNRVWVERFIGVLRMDVFDIDNKQLAETLIYVRDIEVLAGMERIVLSKLFGCIVDDTCFHYVLFRFVHRTSNRRYRGYDEKLFDRYEYSNSPVGIWDESYVWTNGIGFWDPVVRQNYFKGSHSVYLREDFCRDPRIVEDVLCKRGRLCRKTFYKKLGIVDEG